jgi:hypothetical protein
MKLILFYLGLGFQLIGFAFVGICLYSGMNAGDYGKEELVQFLIGMILFYSGNLLRNRSAVV